MTNSFPSGIYTILTYSLSHIHLYHGDPLIVHLQEVSKVQILNICLILQSSFSMDLLPSLLILVHHTIIHEIFGPPCCYSSRDFTSLQANDVEHLKDDETEGNGEDDEDSSKCFVVEWRISRVEEIGSDLVIQETTSQKLSPSYPHKGVLTMLPTALAALNL